MNYSGISNPAAVTVTLYPGWTLISNITPTAMTGVGTRWMIDGTSLNDAITANKIGGDVYWWNGSAYDSWKFTDLTIPVNSGVIEPWKSYWILNMDTVSHILTIQ